MPLLDATDALLDALVRRILAWAGPWLERGATPSPRPAHSMSGLARRRRVHAAIAPIELPPDDPCADEKTRISPPSRARGPSRRTRREALGLVPLAADEELVSEREFDPATGAMSERPSMPGRFVVRVAIDDAEPTIA